MRKPKQNPAQPTAQTPNSEEAWKRRTAELAATLILADLDDNERAYLAICQRIYRRCNGCNSPFEEFFHDLTVMVEAGRFPTPEAVAHKLDEFRENFDHMTRDARQFLEAYPNKAA
jgi:hypothetical protein